MHEDKAIFNWLMYTCFNSRKLNSFNQSIIYSLKCFTDDTNFVVRNFFRDPDKMKDTLVNQLNVMSDDIADALLNANLNIPQVNVAFCSNSRI